MSLKKLSACQKQQFYLNTSEISPGFHVEHFNT